MSRNSPRYWKSPVTNSSSSVAPFIGADEEGSSGSGEQNKSAGSSKLLSSKCFSCGDKGHPEYLPRIVGPPPGEILFKNGVRALWADKHSPRSLSAFQCHAQQTQQLKQLISGGNCPHLLLQGPSGAGKKSLAIALLHDIFGEVKFLPEHRPFNVQGGPHRTITVPIATSKHHVEVNLLHIGEFDKDVLPAIFKEITLSSERALNSPMLASQSDVDYKLILVLNGEKLSEAAQQILHRHMDRYVDTCKLVLCCNLKDATLTKPVLCDGIRNRCQIINVEVPSQEEMVRVLAQVAKKEDINLPKAFAARITEHCRDSLRKAIVQLEACKNNQYPFTLDQPVHMSHWEEDVIQIVAVIVADPTPKRLFVVRTQIQALLTDCVSPILILQKLLEEFLLRTDLQLKKEICHWAGFYETRLQTVPNSIIQLEAFLAKVVSIYKTQSTFKPRLSLSSSTRSSFDRSMEMSPKVLSSSSPLLQHMS